MEWPVHDEDAGTITGRGCNGLKRAALSTPSRRRAAFTVASTTVVAPACRTFTGTDQSALKTAPA